ncbi:MAG TPA: ATP-binding protein [Candidatus Acidoferrum sp.]|nr:ATP-binding protein [Candidatus Acidoferrum sp.]
MDRPNTRSSAWWLFPGLALVLFVLHVLLLETVSYQLSVPLTGGLLQLGLGIVTVWAALHAAKRSEGFTRTFWRFHVGAFSLWILAQAMATFYDAILQKPLDQPWPSDLLYFLWTTPIFLVLFLDPTAESQQIEWAQWLDFAQVGILVVSLYLFVFEVPGHWQSNAISVEKLALLVSCIRDLFLIACFAYRTLNTQDKQVRSLFGRTTIFLTVYSVAECPYLYLQVYERLRPGTLWDIPWSLAFVVAIVLIASAPSKEQEKQWFWPEQRKSPSPALRVLLKLVPLFFPMAVLLMAAHIAEQQFLIATVAVISSFACSGARIILTERKQLRSDAALEEKTALLKSVFEGAGEAIFVKDIEGKYLIVNKAVAKFFGRPIEQIVGKTAFALTDSESARKLTATDQSILESGESTTVDFQMTHEGVTEHFLVTRAAYRNTAGKIIGIIGITRNITKYREIEERLRQSQKMEAIGTLAGGVAHDFNNILMVISGYSSVLADALQAEPKLAAHVEQIQKSAERAASLTRQLLAFSRKQTVQPTHLNLNEVVTGIEKLLHRLIGEDIEISTKLEPDLGTVLADSGQMEQIILNLAVNARDAMPEGGKLTIETRRSRVGNAGAKGQNDLKPGEYVELLVVDSGVGMTSSTQSHIFEPFFTTKPAGKGTGLGLSTVYGIVQQAGGFVTFESAPGLGTSFHIFLPRIQSPAKLSVSEGERTGHLHGGETVLLVEDDAAVCELVRAVLASQGYSVLAARHPQEAETICKSQPGGVQLLLTDVIMPEMTGPELAKRLTALHPQMRVLFMSGYIDDSVVRQEIRDRGIAYMQKPFSPTSLAKKIREVLDSAPVSS